jgi:hypothetical protein
MVANEKEEKIRRKKKEIKNPYRVPSLSKNVSKHPRVLRVYVG